MGARFVVLAISAALTGSCLAQVTGRLTGSVTDASGAAIPHATVNLFLPGGAKPLLTTVTTSDGLFSFTLNPGTSAHFTFTKAGTFDYMCAIHTFMTGKVIVRSS